MTCLYCGTPLPADAMFCVECGRPVRSAHLPPSEPRDTAIIEPLRPDADGTGVEPIDGAGRESDPGTGAGPDHDPGSLPDDAAEPEVDADRTDGHSDAATPGEAFPLIEPESATRAPGQSYILQFSTGEIVTVTGSGLIGRNPTPQPTEYFDHLVTIVDPARSVSKTHLEFGQERGALWVSDRFSANGTVVVVAGEAPRRCEPGRRIQVIRGSRVDIAEQYFIVS